MDELKQVTAQDFSYGPTANQIVDTWEYDYGGTKLLRRVHTDYVVERSYAQQHIFSLPEAIEIYDEFGSLASRTEYLYDTEPLVDTPGVVHHSAEYNPFAAPIFHPGHCKEFCPSKPGIDCIEICTEDKWETVYDPATRFRGNLTQIKQYEQATNRSGPIGALIGYAGRIVDEEAIGKDTPRYLFPGSRERNGTRHEFRKSAFLYNGFRVGNPSQLVVVESFTGVWWLTQAGITNVVAFMGASCSEMQADLLRDLVPEDGSIWLFPDGDKAGERMAEETLVMLAPYRFMRLLTLLEGQQPTDRSPEELRGRLHLA
jgi:hypothetical protein